MLRCTVPLPSPVIMLDLIGNFFPLSQATMVIQCIVYSLLSLIPKHCYAPPFTLVMAAVGVTFGIFGVYYFDEVFWATTYGAELLKSLRIWANMQADAILFVLLPPLLFDAAYNVDFHIFSKILPTAVIMALPGVILAGGFLNIFAIAFALLCFVCVSCHGGYVCFQHSVGFIFACLRSYLGY